MTEQFSQETPWPDAALGPYTIDVEAQFRQAIKGVLNRAIDPETARELRDTQDPPDLERALKEQQNAIVASLSRQRTQLLKAGADLHAQLFAIAMFQRELGERLNRMRSAVRSLEDALRLIDESNQQLDTWVPIISDYRNSVRDWARPTASGRQSRGAPPALTLPPSTPDGQDGKASSRDSVTLVLQERLGVVVSAPVVYEARDFVLSCCGRRSS